MRRRKCQPIGRIRWQQAHRVTLVQSNRQINAIAQNIRKLLQQLLWAGLNGLKRLAQCQHGLKREIIEVFKFKYHMISTKTEFSGPKLK